MMMPVMDFWQFLRYGRRELPCALVPVVVESEELLGMVGRQATGARYSVRG
jgi:hypothetical protein